MNGGSGREALREFPWLTYLSAGFAAYGLKAHYSRATVDDLGWILQPTARLVGWWRTQPLLHDADLGWIAPDGWFVIAPACAGVNFLILAFAVAILGFAHRFRSPLQRCTWFVMVAAAVYLLTVSVNAVRIVVAVGLYRADVHAGWLTADRQHRLAGALVYLAGLWAAWFGFDELSSRLQRHASSGGRGPRLLVPAAYITMTVVVPFLNGAWRHFGAHYVEHAITVSLIALSSVPLLSLMRWVTSGAIRRGPTGPGMRTDGDGQTDDSGGRRRAGDR